MNIDTLFIAVPVTIALSMSCYAIHKVNETYKKHRERDRKLIEEFKKEYVRRSKDNA
jgi:hypothetical protein